MRPRFYYGLLLGVLLASGAFWVRGHYTPPLSPAANVPKGARVDADQWLLPKDFSLNRIYTEPEAMAVLEAPERITIHRAGQGGPSVLGRQFADHGINPSAQDAKILVATFQAANAYTVPSACAFQPGVLVRLDRGEHHLDLLVCFTCEDLVWVLDDKSGDLNLGIGLSDIGIGSLRSVLNRVFPDDPAFKPL